VATWGGGCCVGILMMLRRFWFAALLGLLVCQPAAAAVVVLVHGYASDASTWELSGINGELELRGWLRGGVFTLSPAGVHLSPGPGQQAANRTYSVNLPAEAPLGIQADLLRRVLEAVRLQHPGEALYLAGHSAGGVVARMVVLGANPFRVAALVTIASPHLGTVRAAQGLDVVDSKPFFCPGPGIDLLKSLVGGSSYDYLKYSRGVLLDLLPAESGNVLFWLNQQPHPDIRYYAVVHQTPFALGDELVPAYSQDLNNVPALRGRAEVLLTSAGHSLNPQDGILLAGILNGGSLQVARPAGDESEVAITPGR
jgi:triacylglycerol lipase